jgi:DNA-binding response OmpR family regulator
LIARIRTEFDVLDALSAHPRQAFTRRQLIDRVWDSDWVGAGRPVASNAVAG